MFVDRQIGMLQELAEQAAIAIDTASLCTKLPQREHDLSETLEQQRATSDILKVISQSQRDVQPVFEVIAANAQKLTGASAADVLTFDGELIHIAAAHSFSSTALAAIQQAFPTSPTGPLAAARAIRTRSVVYIPEVPMILQYLQSMAEEAGFRCALAVPMLHAERPIGAVVVTGDEPAMFSDRQIGMLQAFADQAVAIRHRAVQRTRGSQRSLAQSLEPGRARRAESVRAISTSPNALDSVFDLVSRGGGAETDVCLLWLPPGKWPDAEAPPPAASAPSIAQWIMANPQRSTSSSTCQGPWRTREIPDVKQTTAYREGDSLWTRAADEEDIRTVMAVPLGDGGARLQRLLRGGAARGTRASRIRHRALLETFADHAVVAIENARLFSE